MNSKTKKEMDEAIAELKKFTSRVSIWHDPVDLALIGRFESRFGLKLPEDYRIEILISLGYPEGEVRPRRLRPMEELLHFNAWQEEV